MDIFLLWKSGKTRVKENTYKWVSVEWKTKCKKSSKSLGYTGLHGDLEHLTIETSLISESFECVMGECVI